MYYILLFSKRQCTRNVGIGLFLIIMITYVSIFTKCAYSFPNVHTKEDLRL
jgi:hypothetical protein